jgi:hypothetical protein
MSVDSSTEILLICYTNYEAHKMTVISACIHKVHDRLCLSLVNFVSDMRRTALSCYVRTVQFCASVQAASFIISQQHSEPPD